MSQKDYSDKNRYRLALDIGSSSIGWAIFALNNDYEPTALCRTGVRIFSDGRDHQTKESPAVKRRKARQARRMRDRYIQRREKLISALKDYGLTPCDNEKFDKNANPLELRKKALYEQITLHELGRAIFHLSKKRGFKSNRKTDKGKKKDTKIDKGDKKTEHLMSTYGAKTYGELMHRGLSEGFIKCTKVRYDDDDKNNPYDFYPLRALIEKEFNIIWAKQKEYYPDALTEAAYKRIHHAIFYQRPLKPQQVGYCTFEEEEERASKALPIVQEFLLFQELNNLKIRDESSLVFRELCDNERKTIYEMMDSQKSVTFTSIRKKFKYIAQFNLEHKKKKKLCGNIVNFIMSEYKCFGDSWAEQAQNDIIEKLISVKDDDAVYEYLAGLNVPKDNIANIMDADLPTGYIRLSVKALEKILPYMRSGLRYDEACKEAGYKHYLPQSDEVRTELPYYGELLTRYLLPGDGDDSQKPEEFYGKISNPTVHLALNELRKIVNAMIKRYGNPQQIVVEMARDLPMGAKGRNELISEQNKNQKDNERIVGEIEQLGEKASFDSILRYKLWEEQGKVCVYRGKPISAKEALSYECEIDHILPYSKTHDDSKANKVLCIKNSNQYKKDRSPYQAWHDDEQKYKEILDRAEQLPPNKKWRFLDDAMAKYEGERGFEARQLNDTRYMSRLAYEYLHCICKQNNNGKKDIWTVNGALTSMLRRVMGLNHILGNKGEKNRNDHRHHAVDAVTVGIVSRSMVQQIHTVAEKYTSDPEKENLYKMLGEMRPPFPLGDDIATVRKEFRHRVKESINKIIVSHKPDHGKEGQLHEETAYNKLSDGNLFVHEWKDGMRRLKVVKEKNPIPICHKNEDKPYKWFISGSSNYYIDLIDNGGKCIMECIIKFESNKKDFDENGWEKRYPEGKLIMRLYKSDILCYEGKYYIITGLNPASSRVLCAHINDARDSKNREDKRIGQTELFKNCKRVLVDLLGDVHIAKRNNE